MNELFPEVPRNKTKLELVKEQHGIQTHESRHMEPSKRWLAVWRKEADERLDGYEDTRDMDIPTLFAGYCRLIDEWNLCAHGASETESVFELCRLNNIPVIL